VFVGEHLADLAARLGASVVGSEDAARVAGGELTDGSAEFAVEYLGVEATGDGVVVGRRRLGPRVGEGGCGDVLDQGIKFSLTPEVEAHGNALLDLVCLDTAMFPAEDAGHEDQWALGVPFALSYSPEFGSHQAHDFRSDLSLGWQVELVWVGHYCVVPGLPDLVIGNAPIQMPAIIAVDGVTVDRMKFTVSFGVLSRVGCRMCGFPSCDGFALFHVVGVLSGACVAVCGVICSTLPAVLGVRLLYSGSPSSENKQGCGCTGSVGFSLWTSQGRGAGLGTVSSAVRFLSLCGGQERQLGVRPRRRGGRRERPGCTCSSGRWSAPAACGWGGCR